MSSAQTLPHFLRAKHHDHSWTCTAHALPLHSLITLRGVRTYSAAYRCAVVAGFYCTAHRLQYTVVYSSSVGHATASLPNILRTKLHVVVAVHVLWPTSSASSTGSTWGREDAYYYSDNTTTTTAAVTCIASHGTWNACARAYTSHSREVHFVSPPSMSWGQGE